MTPDGEEDELVSRTHYVGLTNDARLATANSDAVGRWPLAGVDETIPLVRVDEESSSTYYEIVFTRPYICDVDSEPHEAVSQHSTIPRRGNPDLLGRKSR